MEKIKLSNVRKVLLLSITCVIVFINCSIFTANTKSSQKSDNTNDLNLQTPMEKIAETLTKKISTRNSRLLVLTFTTTEGNEHKLGSLFAEKLTTDIVRRGNVIVLDRILFSKQIQENNLSLSSGNDLQEIRKIGELLGLQAIVTGMITTFNNGYGLNCRIIDPKTGFILAAEEAFYAGE